MKKISTLSLALMFVFGGVAMGEEDPYLWLEEIDGERAISWVKDQNAKTAATLGSDPLYKALHAEALAALNSATRIPTVSQRGGYLYNFWKDADHERGIYRRTTSAEFRKPEPAWETVLDIDELAQQEGKPWVFKGINCLSPGYQKCLVHLSPGGGDAVEIREFDMDQMAFVRGGFTLPLAKTNVDWLDEDTLFVATALGEGGITDSGYARIVKRWRRGTPLAAAPTIYEGGKTSVGASGFQVETSTANIPIVVESVSFWRRQYFHWTGELKPLRLPDTATINGGYQGRLIFSLKEDWTRGNTTFVSGAVLVAPPDALYGDHGEVEVLVLPGANSVVEAIATSKKGVLVTMLDNVRSRLDQYTVVDGAWQRRAIDLPQDGTINTTSIDDDSGEFFATFESFTTPSTLYYGTISGPAPEPVKAQAPTFDGGRYETHQFFAASSDGTKVPYFAVMAKDATFDGTNPVHLFAYGGFRISMTPSYSGTYEAMSGAYGKMWLDRGGVFVLANLRGGGEFGPAWHAGVIRENRHKVFEDLEAIAKDLVARKITRPELLAIEGRSNGGLLVAGAMIRNPGLYGAIICGVPLADMKRYNKLLAGASWMAEYGNPDDPADWAFMQAWSPYQNLRADAEYPPVFFFTSTRDDRVHPGHARKMMARMLEQGHHAYYYENIEGGHGGSSTNEQQAHRLALAYTHLWQQLRLPMQ